MKERLLEQLTMHWKMAVRPRLEGLTDDEYFWEPVERCWSLRKRDDDTVFPDYEWPEPDPAPVTTIAWRMSHLSCGIFAMRVSNHFGDGSVSYQNFDYKGTAAEGIAQLEHHYEDWVSHVRAMPDEDLSRKIGPTEGPWQDLPFDALILHINRELIHHAAEIALLRDLYRAGLKS